MAPARRRVVLWIGTAAGIGLIVFLFLRYDPAAVLTPLLELSISTLVLVTVILGAVQFLNALTPVLLLGRAPGGDLSCWERLRVFLAIQPFTLIAPARLSDLAAIPMLKRHYRPGALASSIVLDRVVTLFSLLLLAPLALRFVLPGEATLVTDLVVTVALITVGSTPFLLAHHGVRDLVNRTVLKYWPSALSGFGHHTESLLQTSRGRLAGNLCLTLSKTVLSAATIALLASDFGLQLGLGTAIWMSVLVQLATALPLSIQGLGLAEASLVLLFSINEFPGELGLSITLFSRFLLLVVMMGFYFGVTVPLAVKRA